MKGSLRPYSYVLNVGVAATRLRVYQDTRVSGRRTSLLLRQPTAASLLNSKSQARHRRQSEKLFGGKRRNGRRDWFTLQLLPETTARPTADTSRVIRTDCAAGSTRMRMWAIGPLM